MKLNKLQSTAPQQRRCPSQVSSRFAGLWPVVAIFVMTTVAHAQPPRPSAPAEPQPTIQRIEVEGNQNVPKDQILGWFSLRPGDRFDPARVARALRDLTAKKRFADARVEGDAKQPGGLVLFIVVQEFPFAKQVRLLGTDKLKDKDVRGVMKLGPGSFVTPGELRADLDKISGLYRDKGYFRAAIHDSLEADPAGGQDLVLRIQEGEKASVQRIAFEGNAHAPEGTLRKQMSTRADGFLHGGDLKVDALQQDFDKLVAYYRTLGYLDAQVTGHSLDVGPNGRDLTVRIQIQEGSRYSVGAVTWTGNKVFEDVRIADCIKLHAGAPFDEGAYEASTSALYEIYNDAGYIHFNATPRRDVHENVVNLAYEFDEGGPAKIHHIRVVGNTKTEDKVILREFLILPGETFDRSKLMRSLREVYALGFFEDANFERFTPRDDGSVDLELKVAEKQTGQLGAGAGYSAVNAVTGFLEVAETNLFGTGKRLSLRWEFSRRQNQIDFSYTQPWLLDTPTTLGVDLFNSTNRSRINYFYRDNRTGGALRLGRRLDSIDYTTLSWHYRAESIRLDQFTDTYQGPLRAEFKKGPRRTFSTGMSLRRNSTDNPFVPTAGSDGELSTDLFGTFLGGDESYLRQNASLAWYRRIHGTHFSLSLRSTFGLLHGLENRQVPDYELFRLGGNRYYGVRGYDDYEIVPKGNAAYTGGRAMSIFTTEVVYPFTPKVHGVLFFDAGNTWNSFREADLSLLRKGAGFGIRVEVPTLGQLGLDYGYGFDRTDPNGRSRDGWNLHFNFGSLF